MVNGRKIGFRVCRSNGRYADSAQAGPVKLEWMLSPEAKAAVEEAKAVALKECHNLFLSVGCYETNTGGYGKGFIKKQKCETPTQNPKYLNTQPGAPNLEAVNEVL